MKLFLSKSSGIYHTHGQLKTEMKVTLTYKMVKLATVEILRIKISIFEGGMTIANHIKVHNSDCFNHKNEADKNS